MKLSRTRAFIFSLPLLLALSCTQDRDVHAPPVVTLREVQIELSEMHHLLNGQRSQLELLDERAGKLELSKKDRASIEKRLEELELLCKTLSLELNQYTAVSAQLALKLQTLEELHLGQQQQLDQVGQIRSTVSSISKALSASGEMRIHRVRSGESLDKIARQYHTSIEEIKKANGLSHDRITVGQELKIPS